MPKTLMQYLFKNPELFADICSTNDGLVSTVLSRYARHIGNFFLGQVIKLQMLLRRNSLNC